MRASCVVLLTLLSGCSALLGLDDPRAHGSGIDAPPDVPATDRLELNVTSVSLAMQQTARLHARIVHPTGAPTDVTGSVTLMSSNPSVVTIGGTTLSATSQSGSSTITAMAGGLMTTVPVTVTTATCHPVINEVMVARTGSADEFVELFNPCTSAIGAGWGLKYRAKGTAGTTDVSLLATLGASLPPGGYWLGVGVGYPGTLGVDFDAQWTTNVNGELAGDGGAVGLRSGPADADPLIDSLTYGSMIVANHPFTEGSSAPAIPSGMSAARLPFDGNDTDHGGTDFAVLTAPTPHTSNNP